MNLRTIFLKKKEERAGGSWTRITNPRQRIVAGVFLVSNPIGWGISIGVGIYFGARLIYNLSTEP